MTSSQFATFMLAGALTLIAAPAFAQDHPDKGAYYDDEIVVTAPYVEREVTGRDATGARIETLHTSRSVETGDLNLRYNADVRELYRRISDAAANACRDIENRSDGVPIIRRSECIRDAEHSATAQADSLINYARG